MKRLVIKNTRIVDPAQNIDCIGTVIVENEKIKAIVTGNFKSSWEDKIIDGKGLVTSPGFIDTHSHFRDPGFTEKEDIFSGALSAAAGGYTGIIMMANTKPAIDRTEILKQVLEKGSKTDIRIYSAANVTEKMEGRVSVDIKSLKNEGAKVFTDDGKPITCSELMKEIMKLSKAEDVILSFHEEDPKYVEIPGLNKGMASKVFKTGGADRLAEITMVKRDIEIAKETGAKILIQHISAGESVELVRQGKKKGVKVFAEATPHHFSLTEENLISAKGTDEETLFKMNPPLRTEWDRQAIIEGLTDGTIDLIATDHAPHTDKEKARRPFAEAPSGITGLETALSLGIMNLVDPGYLSMAEFIDKMSTKASQIYNIEGGSLKSGSPADIVIFDPEEEWVADTFKSKSNNTPFRGKSLKGRVKYTICKGKVIYEG